MDAPEIGTKFRHPKFPRKVYSFISATKKGDIEYWSFIDVNSGKARFFYPDEVIEIIDKESRPRDIKTDVTQNHSPSSQKKKGPVVNGKAKMISIDGEDVLVI